MYLIHFHRKSSLNTEIDDQKKRLEETQNEKKECLTRVRELKAKKDTITDEEYLE